MEVKPNKQTNHMNSEMSTPERYDPAKTERILINDAPYSVIRYQLATREAERARLAAELDGPTKERDNLATLCDPSGEIRSNYERGENIKALSKLLEENEADLTRQREEVERLTGENALLAAANANLIAENYYLNGSPTISVSQLGTTTPPQNQR